MMSDPVQRFLGVPASSDALTLLGLAPDRSSPAQVDAALRDRLARLFMHPDARSPEAEEVRRLLREAADRLRQARMTSGLASKRATASRQADEPHLNLTDFDRQVLAVMIACGGWNHESRSRLVAISAVHNVSVQGLMRVIQGLGQHAHTGGVSLGMHEISDGVRMIPAMPAAAPGIAEGSPVLDRLAGAFADQLRRDDPSTTIRLCILFGVVTLMVGIFGLRMLLVSDGPASQEGSPAGIAGAAPSAITMPKDPIDRSSQENRLATFAKAPGFLGNGLPAESMKAVDECPALPEHLDEAGRKLAITETPSEAVFVNWEISIRTISSAWVLVDASTRLAIDRAIFEALRNAADEPAVIDRLLRSFVPPSIPAQPLDLWRGSWQAGMLGKFAAATTLPPSVHDRARALLETTLGRDALDKPSFESSVRAWLNQRINGLVAVTEIDDRIYDWWELWLTAQRTLGQDGEYERSLMTALKALVTTGTDLAKSGPTVNVAARMLFAVIDKPSPQVFAEFQRMFDDDAVDSRDLWVLTSLLATNDGATWFPDRLVVPEDADLRHRGRIRDELGAVWPGGSVAVTEDQSSVDKALTVDAETGQRWMEMSRTILDAQVARSNLELMRELVRLSRMGETAEALAKGNPVLAGQILDGIESGLGVAKAAASNPSHGPALALPGASPVNSTRGGGSGSGVGVGQPIGQDGVWALAYEALGKKTKERLESLQALRNSAGSDLGPVDAQVFVHEVYRGSPIEIRAMAQSIVAQQFSTGASVAMEMLDQFPDAANSPPISQSIERMTGALLPETGQIEWVVQARLALVKHVLALKPDGQAEMDAMVKLLAGSFAHRVTILQGESASAAMAETPQAAAEMLLRSWRAHAELIVVDEPFPDDLAGLQRRQAVRLRLAEGPIQNTLVIQLGLLDLLAYAVVAEQPTQRAAVAAILHEELQARARLSNAIAQAVLIERAMLRLWIIRFSMQLSDSPPASQPEEIS